MKKHLLFVICLLFSVFNLFAQNNTFWSVNKTNKNEIVTNKGVKRLSFPKEFDLYTLNLTALKQELFTVVNNTSKKNVVISLPNTKGEMELFEMYEASNFVPELQAQFPEIRAFSGKSLTDKSALLKLSISPQGISTTIFRANRENEFIEPYSLDNVVYAVYSSKRDKTKLPWTCSTEDQDFMQKTTSQFDASVTSRLSDAKLRTMRLAQSCTAEYSNYFGATSAAQVGLVMAAFNATMTRCNGVYEKDLALHLNLIANTPSVIYYNPATDPYSPAAQMGNWNGELQSTLTSVIGEANYDIGHLFGATGGGGNAGCIGCICVDGQKGSGITSPADGIPQGDNFDIDYVTHEIGHQLGMNHSFTHSAQVLAAQREVGSGVTIMGYAGITSYDVARHSIDTYHAYNIYQFEANVSTKACPVIIPVAAANVAPVVNAGPDYVIPISTPFILEGSATDADGDALTYQWEQNDAITGTGQTGASSPASATKTIGPNWVSMLPTSSPNRYMPRLSSILANSATTNGTGNEIILVEALSSVARELNFRLTVRDNAPYSSSTPEVGQTGYDDMKVTVASTAGPFVVSAPNTAVSWVAGTNQSVTWSVANTDIGTVNTKFVDIYLSTDGGNTYPILLASRVPNDGSETITVPNLPGTTNRIMVRGNGNIFFDISNTNFTITAPASTFAVAYNGVAGEQNKSYCQGATATYSIDYKALGGFSGTTTFTAAGNPAGTTVSFSPTSINTNGTVTMSITNTAGATPGIYNVIVTATSGAVSKTVPFYLNLLNSNFGTQALTSPANNAINQLTNVTLSWPSNGAATSYDIQVATDAGFTAIVFSGNVTTTTYALNGLADATTYYWRVKPKNAGCEGVYSAAFNFKTGQTACNLTSSVDVPKTIRSNNANTVTSTLSVATGVVITGVKVNLNITHTYIEDLTVRLTSPAGTVLNLLVEPCGDFDNLNVVLDDAGSAVSCSSGNPALSGVVVPSQPLSTLNGQNSAGTWTLTVVDGYAGDGGTLNSWGLNFCTTQPLTTNTNQINDLVVYPNPNNGNFNIQFTSNSGNEIKVNLHDIRGREIFTKSYSNNGLFNESFQLSNVQSGVYLVTVEDGDRKEVRKILVK
ncbi:zinc-dependent metalloprotease [Flavobacterium sp.]|uniref:zinc-dependent metalloprotease n=1 Tax=Flavobacterium sp. TaxID=239 RepID=UPI002FDDCF37